MPPWFGEDRGSRPRDVCACDESRPAVSAGSRITDHTVLADQSFHEVDVEPVAQERPGHAGLLDVLLCEVVITGERERRIRSRRCERRVDDVLHTRGHRCIYERAVLIEPFGALGSGDHEQHGSLSDPGYRGFSIGIAEPVYGAVR